MRKGEQTGGGAYIGYPNPRPQRPIGGLEGFLQGFTGLEKPGPSVFDPYYDAYASGKRYGNLGQIAMMGVPGMAAARAPLNALHYQATRGMRKPVFGTETAVTSPSFLRNIDLQDPAGMAASSSHLMQNMPSGLRGAQWQPSQGAWKGSQGFEANPLFTTQLPSHGGRVYDQPYMKDLAQLSKNLNQDANAVTRFTPQLIPQMSRANALELKNITAKDIQKLGKAGLTDDMVIASRPGNKAIVMGFDDSPGGMAALLARIKEYAPKVKAKPGTSKQDVDRVYMMKNDEGWAPTYSSFGAQ